MFRRVLLAVLCLVPSSAFGQESLDFGPGLYWRWLIEWHEDTDSAISFQIEGFRESGVFTKWNGTYQEQMEGNPKPPHLILSATNLDQVDRLDTDGDYDVDVDDLNIVRNEFGSPSAHDITGDGVMGVGDLNKVRNDFGLDIFHIKPYPWEPNNAWQEDFNWLSGEVEDACIVLLDARNFANPVVPCSEAMSTPEPSAFALAGIALMALSRRIWSRCRQS